MKLEILITNTEIGTVPAPKSAIDTLLELMILGRPDALADFNTLLDGGFVIPCPCGCGAPTMLHLKD